VCEHRLVVVLCCEVLRIMWYAVTSPRGVWGMQYWFGCIFVRVAPLRTGHCAVCVCLKVLYPIALATQHPGFQVVLYVWSAVVFDLQRVAYGLGSMRLWH
jgi:hypothetical protein